MIDSGYWTLRLFDIGCPDDGGDPWLGRAFIKIEDASNPSNYSELLEFESTITDSITFAIDSLFPGLDTSTTYHITVTSGIGGWPRWNTGKPRSLKPMSKPMSAAFA